MNRQSVLYAGSVSLNVSPGMFLQGSQGAPDDSLLWAPSPHPPQLAQGASHFTAAESARQHFVAVEQHDRHPVSVIVGESGIVGIYDLEFPALANYPIRYERQGLSAETAGAAGDEANGSHQQIHSMRVEITPRFGIVRRLMRPVTVLAITFLLLILAVAGVVFVIQLLSVT